MNFKQQLARLLFLNVLGWAWWALTIAPLANTIFGRRFGWSAFFIFSALAIGGLLLIIAVAKNAVKTRRYI